jgi:hypothetical protein
MFGPLASRFQLPAAVLGTLAAAALALMAASVPTRAASLQAQMQELADNTALAGVNALGTSDAQADTAKHAEAIHATQRVLAGAPGVEGEITASVQKHTVTVKLSSQAMQVASTARYVAPEQPSNFAWASRQHFAVNRPPVVVVSRMR